MKKTLLIKPPYNFFPVGMAHVITALKHNNIPYDFVDLLFDNSDWRVQVERGNYLAVATGGLIGDFNYITGLVGEAKALSPSTPVILGGNITFDLHLPLIFQHMPVDYAVIGEGKITFPELLFYINEKNRDISSIEGIAYRDKGGESIVTRSRKRIDLQKTGSAPVWDDINLRHYINTGVGGFTGFRAMPLLTGRGCIGKCTFCSPTNGPFLTRAIDAVINEINNLNDSYDFDGFAFINEIFYPNRKMIESFASAYKKTGIDKPWVCLLRVDVDEKSLQILNDAGCIGISFGVESGSDRILSLLKKNVTVEDTKRFYRATRRARIPAFGSFMLGSEGETENELAMTIDFLVKEEIAGPQGLAISYPGTEIYRNALSRGDIKNELHYIKKLDFSHILN